MSSVDSELEVGCFLETLKNQKRNRFTGNAIKKLRNRWKENAPRFWFGWNEPTFKTKCCINVRNYPDYCEIKETSRK